MGTGITLSLNDIDIDYGKNEWWKGHHWLFPPNSLTTIEYRYVGSVLKQPGFETNLSETYLRLCHLGYSWSETRTRFEDALMRWNRTGELALSFDEFCDALVSIDFTTLKSADLEPYVWDFRLFVVDQIKTLREFDWSLEDFIRSLDFVVTLRVLAEKVPNRALPLRWHHHDLVESGWVTLEDLTDIDRQTFTINHTQFVGRLQDHAGVTTIGDFDRWLVKQGVPKATKYIRIRYDGTTVQEVWTLPCAVRNVIHHPENIHNVLSDADLRESIEVLLDVAKRLPSPLLGLN